MSERGVVQKISPTPAARQHGVVTPNLLKNTKSTHMLRLLMECRSWMQADFLKTYGRLLGSSIKSATWQDNFQHFEHASGEDRVVGFSRGPVRRDQVPNQKGRICYVILWQGPDADAYLVSLSDAELEAGFRQMELAMQDGHDCGDEGYAQCGVRWADKIKKEQERRRNL